MEIPRNSLQVMRNGRSARLRVADLPIADTFFFSNNVAVSAQISVDVTWKATSAPVQRGEGGDAEPPFHGAFLGEFADATCTGRGSGAETGFQFETGMLTADGFFAEFGRQRNGVFLG